MALLVLSAGAVASASVLDEGFESYVAGSAIHGQGGWKGWNNDAAAGASVSDAFAYGGSNSIAIAGASDLVHEFDVAGGVWVMTAMQYIPSGGTGTSWFILLNSYDDNANQDWSVQTQFDLANGAITSSYTSRMRRTDCSHENSRARARPRSRSVARSSSSVSAARIPSAIESGL